MTHPENHPITHEEMIALFGNTMPVEAASLLTDYCGQYPRSELRHRLRQLAARKVGKVTAYFQSGDTLEKREVEVDGAALRALRAAFDQVEGRQ